eukprot:scaffold103241_cov48-Phaeocystis_antarctica.AAC.2
MINHSKIDGIKTSNLHAGDIGGTKAKSMLGTRRTGEALALPSCQQEPPTGALAMRSCAMADIFLISIWPHDLGGKIQRLWTYDNYGNDISTTMLSPDPA